MVIVQVSKDKELLQSVQLYSEDGLQMVRCSAVTLVRHSAHSLFISTSTQNPSNQRFNWEGLLLKWPFVSDSKEESAHSLFEFPGIKISTSSKSSTQKIVLKWMFIITLEKKLSMFIIHV